MAGVGKIENLKPFEKGNKAAVGHGRPKGSISFAARLRKALETQEFTIFNAAGEKHTRNAYDHIIANLISGAVAPSKDSLGFIKEILDRDQGKPLQQIDQTTTVDFEADFSGVPREYLDMMYAANKKDKDE